MCVNISCDKCGSQIGNLESVNVFRMWNIKIACEIPCEGLSHIPFDEDFYICDECFEKLFEGGTEGGE